MQQRAEPEQELHRVAETLTLGQRPIDDEVRAQGPEDPGRFDVAKSARRVLHVRLELVDRPIEPFVSSLQQLEEGGYDETAAFGRCRLQAPLEAVVQTPVAGQEPDVEQRKQQLRVIRLDTGEVGELANVLSHGQPEGPQRLQERRDGELLAGTDRPFGHDQQIDIRVKAKRPSAMRRARKPRWA